MCGFSSDLKGVTSGVPQGSLIGPYLFGLYVSSLRPLHDSTVMIKYVNDICLVAGIRQDQTLTDINNINAEIRHVSTWSCTNNLRLNEAKTSGFIRYRGHFRNHFNVESMIQSVTFVNRVRFLGVFLDSDLKWNSHINFILKKCSQRMYILYDVLNLLRVTVILV